jgi:VWFA-related protein
VKKFTSAGPSETGRKLRLRVQPKSLYSGQEVAVKSIDRRVARYAFGVVMMVTAALVAGTPIRGVAQQTGRSTQQQPTTKETRDRHVYMTVVDKNDAPVTDLTAADVTVREDGVAREISSVTRANAPMQIALLVDDSAAAMTLTMDLRQGLTGFVNTIAETNPDTEFSIITFGERPTTQAPFTTSLSLVTRAINKIMPRSGAGAYFLQAIEETAKVLKKKEGPRPIMLAFVAEDGPEFSNASHDRIAGILKDSRVALWTIILQGDAAAANASNERRERASVLTDVAAASGGGFKSILDHQGIVRAYSLLASQLTSQLDVMYARPDRLIPPTKMEVTVKRPGLRVIAPNWAGQR